MCAIGPHPNRTELNNSTFIRCKCANGVPLNWTKKPVLYNRRHCVILSNRKNFFEDQILAELKAHVCYYLISPVLSRITTMCCFTPRSIHYAIEFFFSFSFYCTIHTYIHTHPCMILYLCFCIRSCQLINARTKTDQLKQVQELFECVPT